MMVFDDAEMGKLSGFGSGRNHRYFPFEIDKRFEHRLLLAHCFPRFGQLRGMTDGELSLAVVAEPCRL